MLASECFEPVRPVKRPVKESRPDSSVGEMGGNHDCCLFREAEERPVVPRSFVSHWTRLAGKIPRLSNSETMRPRLNGSGRRGYEVPVNSRSARELVSLVHYASDCVFCVVRLS